jgi:hypothetical protein
MIADFTSRLKATLNKRREHLTDSLVKASRDDHDRIAGQVVGIDHALSDMDALARKFLVEEDEEAPPSTAQRRR